jgi:hypothetical protein
VNDKWWKRGRRKERRKEERKKLGRTNVRKQTAKKE